MPSPSPSRPAPTPSRSRVELACVLAAIAALGLAVGFGVELQALQKMAGGGEKTSAFADMQKYLDGLRDGLIPLAIPLGSIGLVGGGVAYMVGNAMAQRMLGGVVIGLALCLLGPSIIA